jgi:aldehyde dehydrogenase (NAD+)
VRAPRRSAILARLGVPESAFAPGGLPARSPITGEIVAEIRAMSADEAGAAIGRAHDAFLAWRRVPAPRRGEFVRLLGEELRAHKTDLGRLVTLETGKIVSEGAGEVQEMIDICDFAVGLSRQLYGLTIATERRDHRMMETWHPLGVCGVISAFNFPVAVWSWNAALAFVCGDTVVWKPSEKTPLTALGVHASRSAPCAASARRRRRASPNSSWAGGTWARFWSTTTGCPSSPPRARPPWAARSRRGSRRASPAPSWSWAATTRPS